MALRSRGTARPGPKTFSRRRRKRVHCIPSGSRPCARRVSSARRKVASSTLATRFMAAGPGNPGRRPGGRPRAPPALAGVLARDGLRTVELCRSIGGKSGLSRRFHWAWLGVPWLRQGRATSGAGTSIPTARNRLLQNGPKLGDTAVVGSRDFPGLGRMFMAALIGGLWHFVLGWVRQAPHDTPRIGTVVGHLARRNRVAPRVTLRGWRMPKERRLSRPASRSLGFLRKSARNAATDSAAVIIEPDGAAGELDPRTAQRSAR